MFRITVGRHIIDDDVLDFMNKKYKEALAEAAKEKRYVRTYGMSRTGKTTSLVEFAKENDYVVVVDKYSTANELRMKFDYKHIYSKKSSLYVSHATRRFVIDDDVHFSKVNDLPHPVLTGFISRDLTDEQIAMINDLKKRS